MGLEEIVISFMGLIFVGGILFLSGIKVIMQYDRGVKFTLGRYSGIMNPGLNYVFPLIQKYQKFDMRVMTQDIAKQEVITKDNIPIKIDAVVYYKVIDPKKVILTIKDHKYSIAKYGQTSLRDVAGDATLDELLSDRVKIAEKLRTILDNVVNDWGLDVEQLELQHIELPENLKRVMASQAEAEREKRGVIIKAKGEVIAAKNFAIAAEKLSKTHSGLFLRTLEEITSLSPDNSQTNIYCVPEEAIEALKKFSVKK